MFTVRIFYNHFARKSFYVYNWGKTNVFKYFYFVCFILNVESIFSFIEGDPDIYSIEYKNSKTQKILRQINHWLIMYKFSLRIAPWLMSTNWFLTGYLCCISVMKLCKSRFIRRHYTNQDTIKLFLVLCRE